MKRFWYFIAVILMSVSSIKAQDTKGTDFWLTFGQNSIRTYAQVDLQIRIVGYDVETNGTLYFTNLPNSIDFHVFPREVKTINLSPLQKQAVYNESVTTTKSNLSLHITSGAPVVVYALNQYSTTTDATNVLPTSSLGTEYYLLSYLPYSTSYRDAYTVVANQNNTEVFVDGALVTTLNAGQVYYAKAPNGTTNLTGTHITSSAPVSVFADNQCIGVPNGTGGDKSFQQMAPVETWGKTFFVPLATQPIMMQRVRAIAYRAETTLTVTGGTLKTDGGGKNSFDLDAGEWLELEITSGCYIESNNPIAVCSYLNGVTWSTRSDCAQAWVPAIDQSVEAALVAPFIPVGETNLDEHYALIVTSTGDKHLTTVSIGEDSPTGLTGGSWVDGPGNMSYYTMPLTITSESYYFENPNKLFVLGYGTGTSEAYYYLGSSSMRNLTAAFFANEVPCTEMTEYLLFCINDIEFTTDIDNIAEIKELNWYKMKTSGNTPDLDYVLITDIVDPLAWTRHFKAGNYKIKMEVIYNDDTELVCEGDLCIGAHINIYPTPSHGGETKPDTGCFKVGTQLPMEAYPY